MAITVGSKAPIAGVSTDLGQNGFMMVRLVLDGTITTFALTLTAGDPIKTIRGCIGGTSNTIPNAGVAGTTGFTVNFAAGTNTQFLDLLIFGEGR